MTHPALPPRVSRPWILCAVGVWLVAALTGRAEVEPLPERPYVGDVTMLTDVFMGRFGDWAIGDVAGGVVLVEFQERADVGRGDVIEVAGAIESTSGMAAGRAYRGVLDLHRIDRVTPSGFLPHTAGRAIRRAVDDALRPYDDGRGLLAGFLIGDTSHVSDSDVEAMRRSGLAHFVAVSGSNVTLFLGLLAVVAGPLSLGPRRRAVIGLAGLPVYVAATRFEPSVIRASVMAGMALAGRLVGVVLEAWQLLSLAVVVLVILDPGLTANVGFQLSVVATAGVLVGARWPVRGVVSRALAVTIAAQVAVAPLLVVHFGSVPLLSPLVNLVAAPLVTASTLVGAIGVMGAGFLVAPAAGAAELVLELARVASSWPQLSPLGLAGALLFALLLLVVPRFRAVAAIPIAVALVGSMILPRATVPAGGVVVLDVGQGDSILLHGGDGRYALIDGGPDPARLVTRLRDYGVSHLELVILTHVHADHAAGLEGLVGRVGLDQVWTATEPHESGASRSLLDSLRSQGITPVEPEVGERWALGILELVVEGPIRRYASPNDQSIVVTVSGPRRTMLLAGDIETFAQDDLDHLRADVLKVPHQGAATSDEGWLREVDAEIAIISVGPNQFGHPADWVIETLRSAGADVLRTDIEGDVVVDLTE